MLKVDVSHQYDLALTPQSQFENFSRATVLSLKV